MRSMRQSWPVLLVLAALSCSQPETPPAVDAPAPGDGVAAEVPVPEGPPLETVLDERGAKLAQLSQKLTGDFDDMKERRLIRVLVSYNHTHYFLDGPTQRGITYEAFQLFETHLNEKYDTGNLPIRVVMIPVARDQLLPRLAEGYADIAAGALTVTDARRQTVDFGDPGQKGVNEIVVTGPGGPASLASVEDLSGQEVWVRPSSSYRDSLDALNGRLKAAGRDPVLIRDADELLEDEDILEMVNAGLLGITVVDDYLANFWKEIFTSATPHPELVLREGGELGWALRKGTPQLMAEVNEFVAENKQGTLMGNVLLKRYLGTTKWVRNAYGAKDLERFQGMIALFQKYAGQYDFDWLLCAAQGYQESGLDQSKRSHVGAVGVMQVMPETARDKAVGILNIDELEPNIQAGIKYLRWVVDNYFDDPAITPLNQMLFAFASYNAGPNRIARLRKEAGEVGLDPNVWFRNVELVVARKVSREPVVYVSNIFKYYLAYKVVAEQRARENERKAAATS